MWFGGAGSQVYRASRNLSESGSSTLQSQEQSALCDTSVLQEELPLPPVPADTPLLMPRVTVRHQELFQSIFQELWEH